MPDEPPSIILDADFLSSFLKIDRCELIRSLYQVDEAVIPIAVHRELARTQLLDQLLETRWIRASQQPLVPDQDLLRHSAFALLDGGEQECIRLAGILPRSIVLMSDNYARRVAVSLGVTVVNIPAFLIACKAERLLDREQMVDIVEDLRAKDYYEFRTDIRDFLVA